jgi:signal transduction histidine kinase
MIIRKIIFCMLACFAGQVVAAEPKRVLLIYNSIGYTESIAGNIRTELERRSSELLEIYLASFAVARAANEGVTSRYADYLGAVFPGQRLDLAVTVGGPAMSFFQQYGRPFFPSTPLLAIVDVNRVPSNLEENETAVTSVFDLVRAAQNILQLLPETTNVSVVIGSAPLEQYWLARARLAFEPYADRVSVRWLNDFTFDDILKHVAALPPRSAILFLTLLRDAAGVAYPDHVVLSKLHAVANAPIFTADDSGFGLGPVGGTWPSTQDMTQYYASVALRILGGEALGGLKLPGLVTGPPKFDWREMRRWAISERQLPPGSTIYFRDPTAWERYRAQIVAVFAAILTQAAMISWLLYERRRRRVAEATTRQTMSDLLHVNRIATASELSASIAHEVNQPLMGIVANAYAGIRWLTATTPDLGSAEAAFRQIVAAGHRASDVIASVRALFKRDTEKRVAVQINQLIRNAVSLERRDIERHHVLLTLELNEWLPEILGDQVQLLQVILNLIRNAIDAVDSARTRTLRIKSERDESGDILVSVEDSGTGIDQQNVGRVFDPLFTTKSQGMGIGLSICRSIIESHDGRIWVTSTVGQGSTFFIKLPRYMAGDGWQQVEKKS